MFTKRQQNPVEKSVQKVLDEKNDCFNRLKHMRIILGNIFNLFYFLIILIVYYFSLSFSLRKL